MKIKTVFECNVLNMEYIAKFSTIKDTWLRRTEIKLLSVLNTNHQEDYTTYYFAALLNDVRLRLSNEK